MRIERLKEDKNNILLIIVAIIIISIVSLYSFSLQNKFEKYAKETLEYNTNEISKGIDVNTSLAINSIKLTSNMITQTMSSETLENARELTSSLVSQTPFDFIEYIRQDGINITDKGEEFDASDRVYYNEGISGKTGIWINYSPKYSDEYLINFYTPLYYDNNIVGVLTGAIGSKSTLINVLNTNLFGEDLFGIICDENNRVIASTVDVPKEGELKDVLEKLEINDESENAFSVHMKNRDSNTFEIKCAKGKSMACTTINEKTGWKVVQIVPIDAYNSIIRKNIINAYIAIFSIILVLIIFLMHIRAKSKRKHKELIREKDIEVDNYERILTTTASGTYKGIRRVDLETAHSDYLYFQDNKVKKEYKGDWNEWLNSQEAYLIPEDFLRVKEFMGIQNLRNMEENTIYRIDYKSKIKNKDGYNNVYSTTISVIYMNEKRTAILTTIDNTAAVANEIDQKRLLASAASIYISMHILDIKNNTLEPLSSEAHINKLINGRTKNIQMLLNNVMSNLTDEQFLDEMLKFIDMSTLDERMQDANTITMEFLGNISGWCRARFIAVDYDENNRLSKVLWVVENIDKEKKKSNQLLYLSETDLMTGIRNRGSGERKINELILQNHEGMFCLLDVDKFKSINDDFGHSVGDKVIIEVANCLKTSFSEKDVVMRLGGDEYAVFAEGITDKEQAVAKIENFFNAIDHMSIPEIGDRKIYVSLGATFKMKDDGLDFETIYKNADSCTYMSKKIKGNVYTFYELPDK
ncbi:MAG: sensor domain-containing diguanylate cyclase [Lachnospiraceae bacterium]|nr:sensor domain-containing diguanylate cyclase [Lachnospiraceae bacterium]